MNKIDVFNATFKDAYTRYLVAGTTASNAIGTDKVVTVSGNTYIKYGFDIRQIL
jgi:hypothetical protein